MGPDTKLKMRAIGFPSMPQAQQSYALVSYSVQPQNQAHESGAPMLSSGPLILDQPQEIGPVSQQPQMKMFDQAPAVRSTDSTNQGISVAGLAPCSGSQSVCSSVANCVSGVQASQQQQQQQQQQGLNMNFVEIGGSLYLVTMPPSVQNGGSAPRISSQVPGQNLGVMGVSPQFISTDNSEAAAEASSAGANSAQSTGPSTSGSVSSVGSNLSASGSMLATNVPSTAMSPAPMPSSVSSQATAVSGASSTGNDAAVKQLANMQNVPTAAAAIPNSINTMNMPTSIPTTIPTTLPASVQQPGMFTLPQTMTQLPTLLNGCHISFMPFQSGAAGASGLSPNQMSQMAGAAMGAKSCFDQTMLTQNRGYPTSMSNPFQPETFMWDRAQAMQSDFLRCVNTSDMYGLTGATMRRMLPSKQRGIADPRTYTNTTLLWTPEKHAAFVEIYDCLVESKEKVTQGAIFKEMKRRYPNFQFTLRQIQSKLQKYRLRLSAQASEL